MRDVATSRRVALLALVVGSTVIASCYGSCSCGGTGYVHPHPYPYDAGSSCYPYCYDAGWYIDYGTPFPYSPDLGLDGDAPDGAGGGACPTTPCNVRSGDGCSGGACRLRYSTFGADAGEPPPLFCDAAGSAVAYDPCVLDAECGIGLVCWRVPDDARCRAYCCGGSGCSAAQECRYELATDIGVCSDLAECDVLAGTGCFAGLTCNVWDAMRTGCGHAGTLTEGETCHGHDDCAPGLGCGPPGAAVCRRYCRAVPFTTPCGAGSCEPFGPRVGLCLPSADGPCDPLLQTGCPDGEACYPDGTGHVSCTTPGTTPVGMPCAVTTDCAGGAACADVRGARICAALCELAAGTVCVGKEVCTVTPGSPSHLGTCQ